MSPARDSLPEAIAAVRDLVASTGNLDQHGRTPCAGFDVRTLVNHLTGTTGAMGRVGRREPLDQDDPWGSHTDAWPAWQERLDGHLADLETAWSDAEAWSGTVDAGGSEMPATLIGEMAFAEVLLHGWDLARATGRDLDVSEAAAGELLRTVVETAELGRQMGAYGPAVAVADDAGPMTRALGASGRDPGWR